MSKKVVDLITVYFYIEICRLRINKKGHCKGVQVRSKPRKGDALETRKGNPSLTLAGGPSKSPVT